MWDVLAIAGERTLKHNAPMFFYAAAEACFARAVAALALLLMAACASYEVREQPAMSPLPQPVAKPAIESAAIPPAGSAAARQEPGVHRARSGETAYSVARRYGVDAYALITANNLLPPFELYDGQRLVIPGTAVPSTTAAANPSTAAGRGTEQRNQRSSPGPSEEPANTAGQRAARSSPPEPSPQADGNFAWPVEGSVISEFGPKGGGRYNDGINIAAPEGAPVRAAASGVVAYAGNEVRGFGNMLLLKHADGWVTAYAHNQELLVQRGERVRRGQVIARVGSSGSVDRPQLHFELRKGKQAVDPMRELSRPSAAARARDSG